jgi:hypothetical protein
MGEAEIGGPCCFCGDVIERTAVDPCVVRVETEEGMTQAWFCHGRCFKERLVMVPRQAVTPAHF